MSNKKEEEIKYIDYNNDQEILSKLPDIIRWEVPWFNQQPYIFNNNITDFWLLYLFWYFDTQTFLDNTYTDVIFDTFESNYSDILKENVIVIPKNWLYQISFNINTIPWSVNKNSEVYLKVNWLEILHNEYNFTQTTWQSCNWIIDIILNIWDIISIWYKQVSWNSETPSWQLCIKQF